jgi:hypothetical protein
MKKMKSRLFLGTWILVLLMLTLARTAAAISATGGNVTTNGAYVLHTFTNSGSLNVAVGGTIEVLVVAGGGGGGRLGGGGGGGGLIYSNAFPVTVSNYTVTVGGGGAGSTSRGAKGGNGTNSVFGPLTATGGGGGGSYNDNFRSGNDGGSGGGAACKNNQTGTTGLPGNANPPGQGNNGGTAPTATGEITCGGGGGAGMAGGNGSGNTTGGAGGNGSSYHISGTLREYAGGGGGGGTTAGGAGGSGGGGAGSIGTANGTAGTANTGGGGGGSRDNAAGGGNGGSGGSGIVIVRYDLGNPSVSTLEATEVTLASATLNGYLSSTGATPTYVTVYWGTTNGGTDKAAWQQTNAFGVQGVGAMSTNISFGVSNVTYYYRYSASNAFGDAWASASASFFAGGVTIVATDPAASEVEPDAGAFTLYRPADATNEDLVVNYTFGGAASNGLDFAALPGVLTIPTGAVSATITFTPFQDMVQESTEDLVLTLAPGDYAIGSPDSATVTIANADISQTILKLDNSIPLNSDSVCTTGRISLGTGTTKGDFKQVYPGSVIKTDTNYLMWYYGYANDNRWRIYLATSPDALTWTKYNNTTSAVSDSLCSNGSIPLGSGDRGDSIHALAPTVIKEGGVFKMWYTGYDNSSYHNVYTPFAPYARIYHATSTNGIDWVKHNNFIVPSSDSTSGAGRLPTALTAGRGDEMHSYNPCVIRDGPVYRMWYTGIQKCSGSPPAESSKTSTVFCATSPDGLTWTKVANAALAKSDTTGTSGRVPAGASLDRGDSLRAANASVIQQGMNYMMWYSGWSTSGAWRIYRATSPDSVTWTKTDNTIPANSDIGSLNGCIAAGTAGRGDSWGTANPVVLEDGPLYRFWYMGSGQGTSRVYAALWAPGTPNIHVAGVSNVSATAVELYGDLTSTGFASTAVSCYWGTTNGGTNLAAWATNVLISATAATGTVTLALNDLVPNSSYAFTFLATNANGQCLSTPLGSFITAPVEVQSPWRGAFMVSRPASTTNSDLPVNYTIGGTATNWVDYYPLTGQEWIRAGATSAVIYIKDCTPGRLAGKTVTLTLAPGGYLAGASTSATTTFDPATWYVATNGVDGTAGTNAAAPLRTMAHALERAVDGDTILVANGTNTISDTLPVVVGVTIRSDPANRNSVVQRTGGATAHPYFRAFHVNHTDAVLESLRIEGGLAGYDCDGAGGGVKLMNGTVTNCTIAASVARSAGCGIYVGAGLLTDSTLSGNNNGSVEGMSGGGLYLAGGTVRGCLIEKNYVADDGNAQGGGAFVAGGLLSHCTIRSNRVTHSAASGAKYGGGVYSSGGTIRNCLLYGNWARQVGGGGYVAGGAWQNCVVIGNSSDSTNGGLFFTSGSATNTIVYNNFSPVTANIGGSWAGRVAYSCAPELIAGTSSNISASPSFANNGTGTGTGAGSTYLPGDYHLGVGSPCLDAGITQAWMATERDFEAQLRLSGDSVDLGIYERLQFDEAAGVTVTLPATNITRTSATLVGYLDSTGTSVTAASVYWGTTDAGTNAGSWQQTNTFAGPLSPGPLSTNVALAVSNVTYYYRYCASNAFGASWATSSVFFIAGDVTLEATDPTASEVGPDSGTFIVRRPAGTTNEATDVYYTIGGAASNGVDYEAIPTMITIPAGTSNATITVTPLSDILEEGLEDVTLTLISGAFALGNPSSATVNIANASVAGAIFKIENTTPDASDGASSAGRIGLGTTTSKGDFKGVAAGSVVKTESGYLMWYSGMGNDNRWRIFLATSPDALTWTKYSNNVPGSSDSLCFNGAIGLGSSARGDCGHARYPSVIKEGPVFKMWYAGYDTLVDDGIHNRHAPYSRVYHATSTNGINWIKHSSFSVPSSDQTSLGGRLASGINGGDNTHAYYPSVIRDGPGYRMWYAGYNGKTTVVYGATSTDGLVWTKVNTTIPAANDTTGTLARIPPGATPGSGDSSQASTPAVIQQGMNYLMWYAGCSTSGNYRIYQASSPDGLTWNKKDNTIPGASDAESSGGRIALGSAGQGDSLHTLNPIVLEDGPLYRFWYSGVSNGGAYRAYAAAWTPDVPNIHAIGGSNVTASSSILWGHLTSTGLAATAVSCYWGPTDGGTNLGAWASNSLISASAPRGPVSLTLSDLAPGSAYAFRFLASNANGQCLSAPLGSFITAPVEILSPWRGAFVVSRPASTTNFDLPVNYTLGGTATNWVDYYPLTGQDWIRAGATSAIIYVRANLPGQLAGKTVTLTLASGGYTIGSSSSATTTFEPVTWHVATNGINDRSGTNWVVPLATVSHAMERAVGGDTILVSNGTHSVNDMLSLEAGVTIRGFPMNRNSILQRNGAATSHPYFRVLYVNHANAVLDGLRLQGGLAQYEYDPLGGGLKLLSGTVTNCTVTGNISKPGANSPGGCGAYVGGGLLIDSTLSGNHNNGEGMYGGGLYLAGGTVRGSLIEHNYIADDNECYGGGAFVAGGLLSHCTIRSNRVTHSGATGGKYGGGVYSSGGIIRNCQVYGNWAKQIAGGGYVAGGAWESCVVVGNSSDSTNGGLYFAAGSATNTIVYNNFGPVNANIGGAWIGRVAFSCAPELTSGTNNVTDSPLFYNNGTGSGTGAGSTYLPGDYHLSPGSPCRAVGITQAWMVVEVDLDGKLRRNGGPIDMGIYQMSGPQGSVFTFH